MKKVLAIVDNWEKLDIYEERLAPYFSVHCAPFGDFGIEMALKDKPDVILLNLAFENMTLAEAVTQIRGHDSLSQIPLVLISEEEEPLKLDLRKTDHLLPGTAPFSDVIALLHQILKTDSDEQIVPTVDVQ